MFRKLYFSFILVGLFVVAGNISVFAQFQPVSGVVELQKADNTREPVPGALIEVYRLDIKAGFPSAKTNKKGQFSFAGMPVSTLFVFSVSAPYCVPTYLSDVKAGQERLVITMVPGDGSKLTEEAVRKAVADGGKTGGTNPGVTNPVGSNPDGTAATPAKGEKSKQDAEIAKKNAEILSKNEKIKQADEIARKSNEEGVAALKAENFDLAIAKFTEGADAVPDFIGSTPILLTGKMAALKSKAYKIYREGGALTDRDARMVKYTEANKYFDDGLKAFDAAIVVIKGADLTDDPAEKKRRDSVTLDLYTTAAEIHRLKAVGGVDTTQGAEASKVISAYIAIEPDPVKKLAAQMTLGDVMRLTLDFENAIAAYRKVLEMKPDHPEAMAGLGLSLFAQGAAAAPEDKDKEQEGLNFLQKYTEIAPIAATDSPAIKELKTSVKETVDYLKSQKMAPQKLPPTKKKP